MEQDFIDCITLMAREQGTDIFLDPRRTKSFLSDYLRNQFKKEGDVFKRVLDTDIPKILQGVEKSRLAEAKTAMAKRLEDEESIAFTRAAEIVDLLGLLFHGDTGKTVPAAVLNGTETGQGLEKAAVRFIAPVAKALIVDDMAAYLKAAESLLAPYRMELHTCTGGSEAVNLAKLHSYDIIFMDHMMPGMDGITAAELIRAWEKEQKGMGRAPVPIIALINKVISINKETFLSLGFNDCLFKPIESTSLEEILAQWIPAEKREQP